jgi:hypothetical protein
MTSMTIITSELSAVDELGLLKAQIADLTKKADVLKNALIAQGDGAYDGSLFRASVSHTSRTLIDADLARKYLTEKQLDKITKVCGTVTVRVSARKAA